MSRQNGPWQIQETIRKYQNEFIEVYEDQVTRPDGQPGQYATVITKTGVSILPVDENGMVYLVQQFRYALGQESLEVNSGSLDGDEQPLDAARREADEELGVEAEEWISLGVIYPDTSIVRGPVYLFVAKKLTFKEAHTEGTETIKSVKIPYQEALEMVMDGRITHAPSCILILKARDVI
jgi:8-oxo-dGTP pyrophosphatase MutT (NUDIX family)